MPILAPEIASFVAIIASELFFWIERKNYPWKNFKHFLKKGNIQACYQCFYDKKDAEKILSRISDKDIENLLYKLDVEDFEIFETKNLGETLGLLSLKVNDKSQINKIIISNANAQKSFEGLFRLLRTNPNYDAKELIPFVIRKNYNWKKSVILILMENPNFKKYFVML